MDYKELKEFIKSVAKSGVSEIDLKTDDLKLNIKVGSKDGKVHTHTETVIQQIPVATTMAPQMMQQPIQQQQPVQPVVENKASEKEKEDDNSKYIAIKAPMVGTFYRKPSPDKDNFVNIGDNIKGDSVVCIIEAMKLFNEIEAEITGKVVKILVEDATPVEFGQELFLVEPN